MTKPLHIYNKNPKYEKKENIKYIILFARTTDASSFSCPHFSYHHLSSSCLFPSSSALSPSLSPVFAPTFLQQSPVSSVLAPISEPKTLNMNKWRFAASNAFLKGQYK